jgi:hypothetical protein
MVRSAHPTQELFRAEEEPWFCVPDVAYESNVGCALRTMKGIYETRHKLMLRFRNTLPKLNHIISSPLMGEGRVGVIFPMEAPYQAEPT